MKSLRSFFCMVSTSMCMVLLAACATTHSAYQPQSKPFQATGSGVQVYGEIDMGYGYTHTKTSR